MIKKAMMQEDNNGDFEIVDKKMASLLVTDTSSSSSSVLTSVAPPSALPSFIASPYPSNRAPPPPHMMAPTPPSGPSFTSPGPVPVSLAGTPGSGPSIGAPVPSPGLPPFPPLTSPGGQSPPPPPSATLPSVVPSQSHPVDQTPVGSGAAQTSLPSRNSTHSLTSHTPPPVSEGSVDASASIDLGSPGVGGSLEKPEGKGWFGWIRGTVSSVGHRVAEKAKTSMDTMITTLDPQMKEFIHSGGDMDIIVASDKEIKVGAVREAFQFMFGKATVSGMAAQAEGVAAQPVGFEAALQSAEKRINSLRSSGQVHPQQPIVSVENFIVEFTPDCWFDLGLLLLDDPGEDILLQTYTQVTPVPPDFVTQARDSTPRDYALKNSGFSTTIGQIASQNLQVHHTMWQETLTGVSRREMIVLAARSLAGLYKSRLPHSL
ncbi:protein PRRC1 isoform X1 [Procambarus clarkii]|uniref:protein PRRC1 isoform X1 n=2 Tax=Procambarus clarkii TaxID=6728 RepID=UPI00374324F6